jgi:GT2 family glycosyltransferase
MAHVFPISAIVPTHGRVVTLMRTLESLAQQSVHPFEILVVDGSKHHRARQPLQQPISGLGSRVGWIAAKVSGAAPQRNQGVALTQQPFVCFFDDDIIFKPDCMAQLWQAIQSDSQLGGVNALIVNQSYHRPGLASRAMFSLLSIGDGRKNFAGRVVGPAVNLLPEDRSDLPEIVPVDWLNLGCTIYRRQALPNPPFRQEFRGYSLMEDLALSLEVAKKWKLANARTARIFHDSRPADYKSDDRARSCMEIVNRHLVMTRVMGKRGFINHLKFFLWELFSVASALTSAEGRKSLVYILRGKWDGLRQIVSKGKGTEHGVGGSET